MHKNFLLEDPAERGTITFTISNIVTFMSKVDRRIETRPQQVAGIEWYIVACPQVVDNVNYLSCYLRGENASHWTAWVDATFGIMKKNGGFGNQLSFSEHLMGKELLGNDSGWKTFVTSKVVFVICGHVLSNFVFPRCCCLAAS